MGSTGVPPVVFGVSPETVAGWTSASLFTDQLHFVSHDGIRRDAEFNPRDAGATVELSFVPISPILNSPDYFTVTKC